MGGGEIMVHRGVHGAGFIEGGEVQRVHGDGYQASEIFYVYFLV